MDRVFSLKEAYAFRELPGKPLAQRLLHELTYQLRDLERRWIGLKPKQGEGERPLKEEIQYQRQMERILCRFEEISRFLKEYNGPEIIRYVCEEIYDLLQDKQFMEDSLSPEQGDQVSVIITVMNSYFLPEISALELITVEEVAQRLKEATVNLLK